ncbi:30S ribosomal protein S4e [Halalkalicoccus salilacus]|uniref:30S ribosomal protein S4e n=1 Tax=Halalkalicoccus salilacus TaxID=3117459 RepID=UPI00300EA4F0
MSKHQKRLSVPNSWPVERKTAKYTVKARSGPHGEDGVPLVIVLRDVLGYVDSTKEAKYAANEGNVLVNGEPVRDVRRPIGMFDILAFEEREEHYRVFPDEGGRLALTPIDAEDADGKLGKIVDKRQVPGGETQLQLHDGRNLRVEDGSEYSGDDSIVISFDDGEILAHFVYEEGALVTAVRGQHAGEIGRVETIEVIPSSAPNTVTVETDDGTFETVEEYIVVIDENFVGDEDAADGGEEE